MNFKQLKCDEHIRLRDGRPATLSAVEQDDRSYRVLLHTNDVQPENVADRTCRSEYEALCCFHEFYERYHFTELTGHYQKLAEDLRTAVAYGLKHAGTDDGGTSNFDAPTLHLPGWNRKMVEQAAKQAGTGCFVWEACSKDCYVFSVPGVGQGYTRTNAAEAMRDYLAGKGYDAGMYYQMD